MGCEKLKIQDYFRYTPGENCHLAEQSDACRRQNIKAPSYAKATEGRQKSAGF